jgi:hypothetical protein
MTWNTYVSERKKHVLRISLIKVGSTRTTKAFQQIGQEGKESSQSLLRIRNTQTNKGISHQAEIHIPYIAVTILIRALTQEHDVRVVKLLHNQHHDEPQQADSNKGNGARQNRISKLHVALRSNLALVAERVVPPLTDVIQVAAASGCCSTNGGHVGQSRAGKSYAVDSNRRMRQIR